MSVDDIDRTRGSSGSDANPRNRNRAAADAGGESPCFRDLLAEKGRISEREHRKRGGEKRHRHEERNDAERSKGRGRRTKACRGEESTRTTDRRESRRSKSRRRSRGEQTHRERRKRRQREHQTRIAGEDRQRARGTDEARHDHRRLRRGRSGNERRSENRGRVSGETSKRAKHRSKAAAPPASGDTGEQARSRRSSEEPSAAAESTSGLAGTSGRDHAHPTASRIGTNHRVEEADRIRKIADEVVRAARKGKDPEGRDLVMLDVDVPGRGEIRIQLRREGRGFQTRFVTDDERLAREIRRQTSNLRTSAAKRGVQLTSIEVD